MAKPEEQNKSIEKSLTTSRPPFSAEECDVMLAERLGMLQSLFPNHPLTPLANDVYLTELGNVLDAIGQDGLDKVLNDCIRSCTFMPTIAEIRKRAGMNVQYAAYAAWDEVQNLLRRHGRNPAYWGPNTPKLDERTQYAVRAVGGLERINSATDENWGFIHKAFIEAYEHYEGVENWKQGWHQLEGGLKMLSKKKAM